MNKTMYEEYMQDKEFERLMAQEDLILEATEFMCEIMTNENIKRKSLADMMSKTKGYVSQILGGGKNLTLRTLSDVAYHLGYKVKLSFEKRQQLSHPDEVVVSWNDHNRMPTYPKIIKFADYQPKMTRCVDRLAS